MNDKADAIAIYADTPLSQLPLYMEFGLRHTKGDLDLLKAAARPCGGVLMNITLGSAQSGEPGIETAVALQRDGVQVMLYVEMKGRPSPQTYSDTIPIGQRFDLLAERGVNPTAVCLHWEPTAKFPDPPSRDAMDTIYFASKSAFPNSDVIAYGDAEIRVSPNGVAKSDPYKFAVKADAITATLYHEEPTVNDFILGKMRAMSIEVDGDEDAGFLPLYGWTSFGFARCYGKDSDSHWGFDPRAERSPASTHYQGKRFAYWSGDPGGIKLVGLIPFQGLNNEWGDDVKTAMHIRTLIMGMRGEVMRES